MEKNHALWYKDLEFLNCTLWISERIQEDPPKYYKILFQIFEKYSEVSVDLLNTTFGLDKGIGKALLSQIHKEYPQFIEKSVVNRKVVYQKKPGDQLPKKLPNLSQDIIKPISCGICVDPIIFLNRKLPIADIDSNTFDLLSFYQILGSIRTHIYENRDNEKIIVPPGIHDIILKKGIQLLGKTTTQLQFTGLQFDLLFGNRILLQIRSNQVLFSHFKGEIDNISSDTQIIQNSIENWASNQLGDLKFKIKSKDLTQKIIIELAQNQKEDLGKIFQIYQRLNNSNQEIPIKSGWKVKIPVEILISDFYLKQNIQFFQTINERMRKDSNSILTTFSSGFAKMQEIWYSIPGAASSIFQISDFKSNLQTVCESNPNLWIQHILARIKECEVFE